MGRKSDEKQGYILYRSWTPVICSLSDADAGKLFKAIARYQEGDIGDICNEIGKSYLSGIFEMMRISFDQNKSKYDATCEKRRESGRAGGKASAQKRAQKKKCNEGRQTEPNQANACKIKQTEPNQANACKIKQTEPNQADIDSEFDTDLDYDMETRADPLDHTSLSDPVLEALRTWIEYKKERREGYKSAGLKALISRVEKAEAQHGAVAVVELIEDCMSAGYQGIVWKLLRDKAGPASTPVKKNSFTDFELQQDYDFEAIERESLNHE